MQVRPDWVQLAAGCLVQGSLRAIRPLGLDRDASTLPLRHLLDALVPPADDLIGTDLELQRRAALRHLAAFREVALGRVLVPHKIRVSGAIIDRPVFPPHCVVQPHDLAFVGLASALLLLGEVEHVLFTAWVFENPGLHLNRQARYRFLRRLRRLLCGSFGLQLRLGFELLGQAHGLAIFVRRHEASLKDHVVDLDDLVFCRFLRHVFGLARQLCAVVRTQRGRLQRECACVHTVIHM